MARIANVAPVGSLAKKFPVKRDGRYLMAIRELPCLICRITPCREAAHVRMGSEAGMARKPSDRRCAPLCHGHHMEQHTMGEAVFWEKHKINPLEVIAHLVRAYPDVGAMTSIIMRYAA